MIRDPGRKIRQALDSRLRGNDKGERGNDKGERGNDKFHPIRRSFSLRLSRGLVVLLGFMVCIPGIALAKSQHALVPTAPINETSAVKVKPTAKSETSSGTSKPTVTLKAPIPVAAASGSALSPQPAEIGFVGMVEVAAVKKNEPQKVSVWTTFPVLMDEAGTKLLKSTNKMMKLKGALVERGGVIVFKVKSAEPAVGEGD